MDDFVGARISDFVIDVARAKVVPSFDAMVKTVTINDYAHKDEFYPFMHDQWTINTSKVKTFLCEIGQRSKVGMTIFLGLVEYSEASS